MFFFSSGGLYIAWRILCYVGVSVPDGALLYLALTVMCPWAGHGHSIGSGQKGFWRLKEINIFHISTGTWILYLRDITFATDVSVPTIETIKLVFKAVFLKQFHFLKLLDILASWHFWNRRKGMSAKKVILRDANWDVDKVCIVVQKTSDNAGWRTYSRFLTSFNTKHLVLWTKHKTLEIEWRNRLKELRIRSGLHSLIVPCQILSCLC